MKKKSKQKRESFSGIFMKRFGIGIIAVLIIYGLSMLFLYKYQEIQFSEKISNGFDYMRRHLEGLVEKQPLASVKTTITSHVCHESAFWEGFGVENYIVVRDSETDETVMDSSVRGLWLYNDPKSDSGTKLYYCETEELLEIYQKYSLPSHDVNPFYDLYNIVPFCYSKDPFKLQRAYIKDSEFIPGSFIVTTELLDRITGRMSVVSEETVEYLDECPQGYKTVEFSDSENESGLFYLVGGTLKAQDLPSALGAKVQYRRTENLKFVYSQYAYLTDASGHSYTICAYYRMKHSFFITNRILLILIAVLYMVVMLFVVWLTTMLTHSRNKSFYMMDDYRRNLINSLAHDLKSPLMSMSGCAENLKENIHTEKREHYVDMIAQNVVYMNHIIDDTLELSRLDSCLPDGIKTDLDLCRLAYGLIEKYEPVIEQKKLNISVEGKYIIYANENELKNVMDNLISNAVKYTKKSGTVLIRGNEKDFIICNDTEEKMPLDIEKLWDAFVKGDESRANKSGSGLGLAIVKASLGHNNLRGEISFLEGRFVVRIY